MLYIYIYIYIYVYSNCLFPPLKSREFYLLEGELTHRQLLEFSIFRGFTNPSRKATRSVNVTKESTLERMRNTFRDRLRGFKEVREKSRGVDGDTLPCLGNLTLFTTLVQFD